MISSNFVHVTKKIEDTKMLYYREVQARLIVASHHVGKSWTNKLGKRVLIPLKDVWTRKILGRLTTMDFSHPNCTFSAPYHSSASNIVEVAQPPPASRRYKPTLLLRKFQCQKFQCLLASNRWKKYVSRDTRTHQFLDKYSFESGTHTFGIDEICSR